MEPKELIHQVWKLFTKHVNPKNFRLFLFGSRTTHQHDPFSDFDFAILGQGPIPEKNFLQLKSEIADLKTLFSIDIIDLQNVSLKFKKAVQKEMIEIIDGKIKAKVDFQKF